MSFEQDQRLHLNPEGGREGGSKRGRGGREGRREGVEEGEREREGGGGQDRKEGREVQVHLYTNKFCLLQSVAK